LKNWKEYEETEEDKKVYEAKQDKEEAKEWIKNT
jgi:hypothetical protein